MLEKVHGQTEGVTYLRRVVSGHMTTPLLLIGEEGVGRRFSVLEAAKEMVADERQIFQVDQGVHPDVRVLSPEEDKDIKVEAVRDFLAEALFRPSRAPLKFLVLDGADRLTPASANALLKVLEEAPDTVRFFLTATKDHHVLPTVLSRCAPVRYQRLPEPFLVQSLLAHTDDVTKATVYARLADGSLGRALRYFSSGRINLRAKLLSLLNQGLRGDVSAMFAAVDALEADLAPGLHFLEHLLHDLVLLPHSPKHLTNLDIAEELTRMRDRMGPRVDSLRHGLRLVQRRSEGSINLAFHVKSMLAEAFT